MSIPSEPSEPLGPTTVTGRARRPLSYSTFADITDAQLVGMERLPGRLTRLTFDGVLCDEQVAAVWARMESVDDEDQAARQVLRDALAARALNLAQITAAYALGDDLPAPTYPEPNPEIPA